MAGYIFTLPGNNGAPDLKVGTLDEAALKATVNTARQYLSTVNNSWFTTLSDGSWGWQCTSTLPKRFAYVYCVNIDYMQNTNNNRCEINYWTEAEARAYKGSELTEDEKKCIRACQTVYSMFSGFIATKTTRPPNMWTYFEKLGADSTVYGFTSSGKPVLMCDLVTFRLRTDTTSTRLPISNALPASNKRAWALSNLYVSLVFFSKQDTPELSIQYAKQTTGNNRNRYYSYSFSRATLLGGGAQGQCITIYIGRNAANQTGVFQDINTASITYEEIFEDSDNTYPGGGDDKNSYPDEGSDELGGESGKGDFDNTNDPIDFPTLPTWDVQSTGFISLWNPTIVQLTDLYSFLWDSDISTTLKKLFNEPMNAIFSLGIVPVDPVTQGTRRLTIGHVDTEIDMESIQKQFVTFDFGSIDINEYYGAAWDYSPYTQASIFLPYIGVQPVDIDDIMNCTLTLRYNIDILTGTTIALLKCARKGRDNLNAVMYEWQGNCVTQCPITAGNWSQIMASVIQLGAMTGLALSQPVAGAIGNSPAMYGSTAGTKLAASASEYADGKNLVSPSMTTFGALNVLGSKVHVQRGGRIDMSAGAMSMQKAFVILNRPVSGIPRGWNRYAGYPSLKIKTLGSQEGFVSVGAIKLDGLRATANEIGELDAILKAGVII